ncbi:MAG TPA: 50S ribosomal protein L13 [Candidatus Omnitrophota bacterium]|nr:50S ribosomal protein L13 [Candidatus Omnitrophota bacterium]HPB68330.1 50S ribosomal protein L13 [Candidatus Omnitrophota bacterium]HQO58772.1 50S ribosomal protein L13 [Candidatus Omnitrophota bacterium]
MNKTFFPKTEQLQKKCYVIDAKDKILGRVATKAAVLLRGKHKTIFTPHLDTGDFVVIINADKVKFTGKKATQKSYQRYSGYPSGQRSVTLEKMMQKKPTQVLRLAINRMIPKGALGNKVRTHLRIYAGDKHSHQAQKPISIEI